MEKILNDNQMENISGGTEYSVRVLRPDGNNWQEEFCGNNKAIAM